MTKKSAILLTQHIKYSTSNSEGQYEVCLKKTNLCFEQKQMCAFVHHSVLKSADADGIL